MYRVSIDLLEMTKRKGKLVLTGMKGQRQHEERKVIKAG